MTRRALFDRKKSNTVGEMVFDGFLVFIVLIWLLIEKNSVCMFNAQLWLTVFIGYYTFDFVLVLTYYHLLLKNRRDNLPMIIIRFFCSFFIVGWLIYGNVKFYNSEIYNDCTKNASGLFLCM